LISIRSFFSVHHHIVLSDPQETHATFLRVTDGDVVDLNVSILGNCTHQLHELEQYMTMLHTNNIHHTGEDREPWEGELWTYGRGGLMGGENQPTTSSYFDTTQLSITTF